MLARRGRPQLNVASDVILCDVARNVFLLAVAECPHLIDLDPGAFCGSGPTGVANDNRKYIQAMMSSMLKGGEVSKSDIGYRIVNKTPQAA